MYKCKKLCLKIDGLVIYTAMQGHPVIMLIHDISSELLENGERTAYLLAMNGDFGDGASAQLIPIGFKDQWCFGPPSASSLKQMLSVLLNAHDECPVRARRKNSKLVDLFMVLGLLPSF